MPNLDAILPIIPRDVRVGVVREHERVEQVEKESALKALQEEEQNSLPQREQQHQQQSQQQQASTAPPTATDGQPASEEDADTKPRPGTHLDTYA